MFLNNPQNLNPGRMARFLEIQRGTFLFTTSMDESIAHASTFREKLVREIVRRLFFSVLGVPLIRSTLAAVCQVKKCIPFTVYYSMVTCITKYSPVKRECGDI